MRKQWLAGVVVGCVVMSGCGLGGVVESASPSVTINTEIPWVEDPAGYKSQSWSDETRGAVDAVYAYLEKWTYISQNLETASWDELYEVASGSLVEDTFVWWEELRARGWHMMGGPEFEARTANQSHMDNQGEYYQVRGCYTLSNGYLADSSGAQADAKKTDRLYSRYEVLLTNEGVYFVVQEAEEEGSC